MAENEDENDRKIAPVWDDFDKVPSVVRPRHVGSERLPKLAGLKREALVPGRNFEKKHRRNHESESSVICSTPRDGAPRHAGGGQFHAWLPAWFCPRGNFSHRVAGPEFAVRRRAAPTWAVSTTSEQVWSGSHPP